MNIYFKHIARDTPNHNYMTELGLLVLANKGRAMMYCAKFPTAMRYQISPKAFETATLLDGLVVSYIDGKKISRYKNFF